MFDKLQTREALLRALDQAAAKVNALTPVERAEMARQQRRSWVLAEAAFGSDADEAAYRRALDSGDRIELERLDREADQRRERAAAYLDREGL